MENRQIVSHLEELFNLGRKYRVLYIIKKPFLFCSFIYFFLSGCSAFSKKEVTFYVTNIEDTEQQINLQVYLNDSLFIDNEFKYSRVTPNYTTYTFTLNKGMHRYKVSKNGTELLSDTFDLKKNTFIYLSYGKENGSEEKIYLMKTTHNYKQH